ncbi:acyl-CoA dehydrogenase [Acrocarpospora pleiomorpha]|uniref:Acyl-CoA dehydrogenase n=1 Tax=Acrocarpospora pleiomorpha TaxID=90975 RepID=A0A5M3XTQ4_9ACTN|nr:acyl-CoA dehydrogenase family protein [Acrocarpospora pleiomorpha]GES24625.1 acyl-CoA dehydrogenase [Acrocarpospora pleiomorpha]
MTRQRLAHNVLERAAAFLEDNADLFDDVPEFLGRQYDAGLAWAHFPEGIGGSGATLADHLAIVTMFADAGAPDARAANSLGWGVIAPAIAEFGTRELQERVLRRLFTGADQFCQLFSEPGAGSDLAGLATRAVPVDGGWLITGQKVWTSRGMTSTRGALLARTDPAVPKHRGITFFILDLTQPGVEVRPLRQITGESMFAEIFMESAFVPDCDRVGDVGDGWNVATTALMNERRYNSTRSAAGRSQLTIDQDGFRQLIAAIELRGGVSAISDVASYRVAETWAQFEALRLWRWRSRNRSKSAKSADGAVGKVMWAEAGQLASATAMELLGTEGLLWEDTTTEATLRDSTVVRGYLRSRGYSIEGGTSEIHRNVIGERILGLDKEASVEADLPWKDIPR